MSRAATDAERRAMEHKSVAREAIDTADDGMARAEREMLELGGAGDPHAATRQRLLAAYAIVRKHLGTASDALELLKDHEA